MDQLTEVCSPIAGCLVALCRCHDLVDTITPEQFRTAPQGHGSIGEHARHCIDHFTCFLCGLTTGLIDYDARERNAALEAGQEACQERLTSLMDSLRPLSHHDLQKEIGVRQTVAPGRPLVTMRSTVDRELVFLSGHMIHHLAIMTMIAELNGVMIAHEMGLAYSTEAYHAAQKAEG